MPVFVSAQYTTRNDYTGSFTVASSWISEIMPNPSGVNNNTNIYGNIICNTSLSINNNFSLTIFDTLSIHGNLILGIDSKLNIESGAICIVYGNVDIKNKADLAFGSHFIVTGNFTTSGNNQTLEVDNGAAFYILGNVSAPNLPGLICDSTSYYIPPGDPDCVYGDIVSLEDNENNEDGIYDFFVGNDNIRGIEPVYTELCGIPNITISVLFTGGSNYIWLDSLGTTIVGTGISFTTDEPGEYFATYSNAGSPITTYRAKVVAPVIDATVNYTDESCPENSDGTIIINNPTGGSGSYEYTIYGDSSWQSSGNFTSLEAGFYDVRIRDAISSCTKILIGNLEIQSSDIVKPAITCPDDITITADAGFCDVSGVSLGTPITSDNCGVDTVINNVSEPYSLGLTTVTWTVEDLSGNIETCFQNITVEPFDTIDIEVVDLGDDCQSGETDTKTQITWTLNKISGTTNWSFDYTVNDGTSDVASGTGITVSELSTEISYEMDNSTGENQSFSLTISNVSDNCGRSELNTTNNSDSVTMKGVPDTSDIISN